MRKAHDAGVKSLMTDWPSGAASRSEKDADLRAKPPHRKRALYATVSTDPTTAQTRATAPASSETSPQNAVSTASLATKPSSGGIPAMEAAPITDTVNSLGAMRPTPESRRMSRVPAWWSITPTARNRVALNRPWAMTMPMPAIAVSAVPKDTTAVMNPSWLTVP